MGDLDDDLLEELRRRLRALDNRLSMLRASSSANSRLLENEALEERAAIEQRLTERAGPSDESDLNWPSSEGEQPPP